MINNCNHFLMLLTYLVNLTSRFTSDHSISSCFKAWYSLEFEGQTKETVVFGQGAKAASSPCDAEAVSIGSRVCNHRSRSPRANLQRRRCHGHAHWGSRRPIDSLHCINASPRQVWFVCVPTVPCSTISKRGKSRAGIAVAVLGWWKNGLERAASEIPRRKGMQRM